MSVTRLFRFALLAAAAIGCSSDATSPPLRGFVYSAASAACGPADGPAVAIYLSPNPVEAIEPSGPYVRVYVAVQSNELTSHVWPIGNNTAAGAWFHSDGTSYEIAESGYLIVNSVDSDNAITGSLEIFFPDAGHIKSDFHAKWRAIDLLCG